MVHFAFVDSKGRRCLVSEEDRALVEGVKWSDNGRGYLVREAAGVRRYLHRLITAASHGMSVDHINGDKSDYRRENLRVCTQSQNLANRRLNRNNRTGERCVFQNKRGKWLASVKVNYVRKHLGTFETKEEAVAARDAAGKAIWGEFYTTR